MQPSHLIKQILLKANQERTNHLVIQGSEISLQAFIVTLQRLHAGYILAKVRGQQDVLLLD